MPRLIKKSRLKQFRAEKSRKIPVTNPFSDIPKYLSDEQAERIGAVLAADFGLKHYRENWHGWQTTTGWFTNKGLARRAHRFIIEGLNPPPQEFFDPKPRY